MIHGRDTRIDIIKGIAIILMVYGHTFGMFRNWVYLFHMPIFFMVSGYCWSEKHSTSREASRNYFFDRAIRLLVPYLICNVLFGLSQNVFLGLGLYTSSEEFIVATAKAPIQQTAFHFLGLKSLGGLVYRIIRFDAIPQLTGPTWFLYALFVVCVVHCFLEYFINPLHHAYIKRILWILIFGLAIMSAWAISAGFIHSSIADRHLRLPVAYALYLFGIFLRRYYKQSERVAYNIALCIVAFIVLTILNRYGAIELSARMITNPMYLLATSFSGWVLLFSVSSLIKITHIGKGIACIGKHTLPIVFLHVIAFKIVSVVIILIKAYPSYMLASFPVIFDMPEWVNLIYTVCGTAVPLMALWIFTRCRISIMPLSGSR